MALARYPSRVFAAWRAIHTQLGQATWPAHDLGGSTPEVSLADVTPERQREVVAVIPVTEDAEIEWVQMGASSREERFVVDIVIRTVVPSVPGDKVIDRLEELADVIQSEFYDTTSGAFTPPVFDGVQQLGGIASVKPRVWPGAEGWEGDCVLRLEIAARI